MHFRWTMTRLLSDPITTQQDTQISVIEAPDVVIKLDLVVPPRPWLFHFSLFQLLRDRAPPCSALFCSTFRRLFPRLFMIPTNCSATHCKCARSGDSDSTAPRLSIISPRCPCGFCSIVIAVYCYQIGTLECKFIISRFPSTYANTGLPFYILHIAMYI